MPIALTIDPREYVLLSERELPADRQTVFLIRPLTSREYARIDDKLRFSKDEIVINEKPVRVLENLNDTVIEKLLCGLVGWKNFKYATGAECPFNDTEREHNLDHLSPIHRMELASAIDDLSKLSEGDVKN